MTKNTLLPSIDRSTVTETVHRIDISGAVIRDLLARAGYTVPDSATVSFLVPSGADWSNTHVDVDDENPVYVRWETRSVESSS